MRGRCFVMPYNPEVHTVKRLSTVVLLTVALLIGLMPTAALADQHAPMPVNVSPATPKNDTDPITKIDAAVMSAGMLDQAIGTRWRTIANPSRSVACAADTAFLPNEQRLDVCDLRYHSKFYTATTTWSGGQWIYQPNTELTRSDWVKWLRSSVTTINQHHKRVEDDPNYGMFSDANGYGYIDPVSISDTRPGDAAYVDWPDQGINQPETWAAGLSKPFMRVLEPTGADQGMWAEPIYEPLSAETVEDANRSLMRLYCSALKGSTFPNITVPALPDGCWEEYWGEGSTPGSSYQWNIVEDAPNGSYWLHEGWKDLETSMPGDGLNWGNP